MKVFISVPMGGRTEQEIKQAFNNAIEDIILEYPDSEIIETVFPCDSQCSSNPLFYLGRAIQLLSEADAIWFAEGWENCRGCRCEHKCAEEYGILIL